LRETLEDLIISNGLRHASASSFSSTATNVRPCKIRVFKQKSISVEAWRAAELPAASCFHAVSLTVKLTWHGGYMGKSRHVGPFDLQLPRQRHPLSSMINADRRQTRCLMNARSIIDRNESISFNAP